MALHFENLEVDAKSGGVSERLLSGQSVREDGPAHEKHLRPKRLSEYVGQTRVVEQLKVFIEASKTRHEALDHTLIFGPPGLGKTTLAQIIAHEKQVGFRQTAGPILEKPGDLAALLTRLEPYDVLFIDEIHRLSPTIEEILYPAMEDGKLDILIGEGPAARSVQLDLQPFTLVGATTRAGLLTSPLRDRFGIVLRLDFYSVDALDRIIEQSAQHLKLNLRPGGARAIAERSRGTPRIANRLLRRVRDYAEVDNQGLIDAALADSALKALEVDAQGLDRLDRTLLMTIIDKFAGGPVGLESLAAALGEEKGTIEEVVEPFLIQQGYLQRTSRGRAATEKTYLCLGRTTPGVGASDASIL